MARRTPPPLAPKGGALAPRRLRRLGRTHTYMRTRINVLGWVLKTHLLVPLYLAHSNAPLGNCNRIRCLKKWPSKKLSVGIWIKLGRGLLWGIPLRVYWVWWDSYFAFSKNEIYIKVYVYTFFFYSCQLFGVFLTSFRAWGTQYAPCTRLFVVCLFMLYHWYVICVISYIFFFYKTKNMKRLKFGTEHL